MGIELAKGRSVWLKSSAPCRWSRKGGNLRAAVALGAKFGVDLPIIQQMHAVLNEAKSPREALRDLMERSLKGE